MGEKTPVTPTYRFSYRYFKNIVVLIASITWLLFLGITFLYLFQLEFKSIVDHWMGEQQQSDAEFEQAFRAAKSAAMKSHMEFLEDTLKIPDNVPIPRVQQDVSMSEPEDLSKRPGEKGQPFVIANPTQAQLKLMEESTLQYGYNKYVSDFISVNRTLTSYRDEKCDSIDTHDLTSRASVIIAFRNEAWSVLLRTIHSVLNRSPGKLLHELILVDDFSDSKFIDLKKPLRMYLKSYPKVKMMRTQEQAGLIKAKLLGAEKATAPILIFLDAHVEVNHGWLEPLVQRIQADHTVVASPVIETIKPDTLEYIAEEKVPLHYGGFLWSLQFKWEERTEHEIISKNPEITPYSSPVLSPAAVAIHYEMFMRLGQYDSNLVFHGGENIELSLKAWTCGGSIEIDPCSRIGHVYKGVPDYIKTETEEAQVVNSQRIAEIWLDDHKEYFRQEANPKYLKPGALSDTESVKNLRAKLKCHPFDWFLKNIYQALSDPSTEDIGTGEIRNEEFNDQCVDAVGATGEEIKLYTCHGQGGNQFWRFNRRGELKHPSRLCVDFYGMKVELANCHGQKGNQEWRYFQNNKTLVHKGSKTCLAIVKSAIGVQECEDGNLAQKWTIENWTEK